MVGSSQAVPTASLSSFYRATWREVGGVRRAAVALAASCSFAVAVLLGLNIVTPLVAAALSSIGVVAIPWAVGALFIVNGGPHGGRAGAAWSLIGLGMLSISSAELALTLGSGGASAANVFYGLAYPMLFVGLLLLPHVSGRRWERMRLTIDALAGSVALGAIAWTLYLQPVLAASDGPPTLVNLAAPIGDFALLTGVLILTLRPSAYQFDGRLLLLSASLILTVAGNIWYAAQISEGTYRAGAPGEALWFTSWGLAACSTLFLARRQRFREIADRRPSIWSLAAPYSAIALLFAMTVAELKEGSSALQVATAVVVVLIIARQTVAIRENRDVVEKQRTDLVAAISHELRTPLAAIGGFVEIMADDPDIGRDDRIEMMDMVRDQTRHLNRIVEDMIELSRDKLSAAKLEHQPLDVSDLIDSSLDLVPDLTLQVTIEVEPGLAMTGDESRLRQILVNYLVNAARYGGGTICIVGAGKGADVVLEVHDNGPGVPKKHEITIWDRFERGVNTYISTVQGSGLGLAIVRQLAEAHGGTAGYRRSELLGGSCFWVSIPVR